MIGNCTLEQHSKNSEVNLLVSAKLPDTSPQPNDLKCSKTLFAVSILKKQFTDLAKSEDPPVYTSCLVYYLQRIIGKQQ